MGKSFESRLMALEQAALADLQCTCPLVFCERLADGTLRPEPPPCPRGRCPLADRPPDGRRAPMIRVISFPEGTDLSEFQEVFGSKPQ
jgi:hypothetical protein